MSKRISILYFWFVAAFIIAGGCRQQHEKDMDVLELTHDADVVSVPSNEAMRAIDATGGLDTWKKTAQLQLDCVVTLYQPDGSFYLTEQHYEIDPWLNSIRISAEEPRGKFVWQWSGGKFDVLEGTGQIDAMSKQVSSCCYAEAILDMVTAPVRFMDDSVIFSEPSDPVRVLGKWYYPINRKEKVFTGHISEAVFYQDRESSIIERIRLACTATGSVHDRIVQYVRGYDYKKVGNTGLLVPTRIEIFETDARDRTQKRLVKIDCHAVECAK